VGLQGLLPEDYCQAQVVSGKRERKEDPMGRRTIKRKKEEPMGRRTIN